MKRELDKKFSLLLEAKGCRVPACQDHFITRQPTLLTMPVKELVKWMRCDAVPHEFRECFIVSG